MSTATHDEEEEQNDHDNNNQTEVQSTEESKMKKMIPIDPARAQTLTSNLASIRQRIQQTTRKHQITKPVRLVAVSKLKPASDILALHTRAEEGEAEGEEEAGDRQIHFGENYVQEVIEKSRLLPRTIKWHFIGGLQSNKAKELAKSIPNLWAVESVDSIKKARLLDKGRGEVAETTTTTAAAAAAGEGQEKEKLRVFVQVNTSGEESKSGVGPKSKELLDLCKTLLSDDEQDAGCPNLKLQGLMTIGAIARSKATTAENENEDFLVLKENRDWVVRELGLDADGPDGLELSMGMSEDFEGAIVQGSDEVRVGSTIFGERPPKKEAKILEDTQDEKK